MIRWFRNLFADHTPTPADFASPRWICGDLTRACGAGMHDWCQELGAYINSTIAQAPCLCPCHEGKPCAIDGPHIGPMEIHS